VAIKGLTTPDIRRYLPCKILVVVLSSSYGPHSFAVAGPTIWNNLTEYLRDPELSIHNWKHFC